MYRNEQTRRGLYEDEKVLHLESVLYVPQTEWEEVKKEMVEEKGLEEAAADRIGEYVKLNGHFDLLDRLTSDERLTAVASSVAGLEDMKLLLQYCELFGVLDKVGHNIITNVLY